MTVSAARLVGARALSAKLTPQLDADLLLGHVLGQRRETILIGDGSLSHEQWSSYENLIARRAGGEPVAYLIGAKSWFGLDLEVTPAVLIPRPETEILVEVVIARSADNLPASIVDVGTGSGAIAVALARALAGAQITAVDISPEVLAVARRNAARYGVSDQISWVVGNLLDPIGSEPAYIVANLPYVPMADRDSLSPEVLREPDTALFGGLDGLDFVRALIVQVGDRRWRSTIFIECDPRQIEAIVSLAATALQCSQPVVIPDLAGHDRVVIIGPGEPSTA